VFNYPGLATLTHANQDLELSEDLEWRQRVESEVKGVLDQSVKDGNICLFHLEFRAEGIQATLAIKTEEAVKELSDRWYNAKTVTIAGMTFVPDFPNTPGITRRRNARRN
jgi:hypothetical protein